MDDADHPWLELSPDDPRRPLHEIASELGEVVRSRDGGPAVQVLRPKRSEDAVRRSLSALHGLDAFPMHTDGAHRRDPPGAVVVRCVSARATPEPTLLCDARSLHRRLLTDEYARTAMWLVDGGARHRFYRSVVHRDYLRIDPGCMSPASERARELGQGIDRDVAGLDVLTFDWTPGRLLLVDNRTALHGRPAVRDAGHRILERCMIRRGSCDVLEC